LYLQYFDHVLVIVKTYFVYELHNNNNNNNNKRVGFLGVIYGLKWNTNNMAEVGITFEDKPIQGITTTAELQFIPLTG